MPREMLWRLLRVTSLVIVGAIAVTWAWNTIVPEISGLPRLRYAEGLSIAVLAVFIGALFESGRQLLGRSGARAEPS